jgi:hypothetical protein
LLTHLQYTSSEKLSPWRKVSMVSWKPMGDSSTYVMEEVVVDDVLHYCKQNQVSNHAFFIKIVAHALQENSRVNSVIRFGKIFARESNSVFFHVINTSQADDLAGFTITEGHTKSLQAIQTEMTSKIESILANTDELGASKKIFKYLPVFIVRRLLHTLSFVMYKLNIAVPTLPKDPFGAVMITSVGSIGMQAALCPIAPYTNNSMVISIGKITKKAVVIDDAIVIKKVITFGFTFDHRLIDGAQFQQFFKSFTHHLNSCIVNHEK